MTEIPKENKCCLCLQNSNDTYICERCKGKVCKTCFDKSFNACVLCLACNESVWEGDDYDEDDGENEYIEI